MIILRLFFLLFVVLVALYVYRQLASSSSFNNTVKGLFYPKSIEIDEVADEVERVRGQADTAVDQVNRDIAAKRRAASRIDESLKPR